MSNDISYFCFMIVIRIPAKPKEEKAQKLRGAAYCRVSSTDTEQIAIVSKELYEKAQLQLNAK